jgi:hypothetical protein
MVTPGWVRSAATRTRRPSHFKVNCSRHANADRLILVGLKTDHHIVSQILDHTLERIWLEHDLLKGIGIHKMIKFAVGVLVLHIILI